MQKLERRLERTERALEQNTDRLHIMDEHLRNVQQELKYTQSRVGPGEPLEHEGGKSRAEGGRRELTWRYRRWSGRGCMYCVGGSGGSNLDCREGVVQSCVRCVPLSGCGAEPTTITPRELRLRHALLPPGGSQKQGDRERKAPQFYGGAGNGKELRAWT